jgi:agmatinase
MSYTEEKPFLGTETPQDYPNAKVVILPIPFEATTTYGKGTENGAFAILEASHQVEYYDDELKIETGLKFPIYTHQAIANTIENPDLSPEEMINITYETVSKLIKDGKFVIGLGGEHSITTAIVKAYQDHLAEPFTVVQIDAHGDLRYEYEGSIYNHACIMHRILDLGLPSVPIAIRAISQPEAELIEKHKIPVIWGHDLEQNNYWIQEAIASIKTRKVFLTIDLDGLDPAIMPGVGTPVPGGLQWYPLLSFLKTLFATYEVIGSDVMELAPIHGNVVSEFAAAKLVYKLIGYKFYQS